MNLPTRAAITIAIWIAWMIPFARVRSRNRPKAVRTDKTARFGIILQMCSYGMVFAHTPKGWMQPVALWRILPGVVFGLIGVLLAWAAVPALGRQWRIDAGLNADHELVRTGPYRFVRHPIYASMVCTFVTAVAIDGTMPAIAIAPFLFFAGIEIRIRTEDALLRERFGEEFNAWRKRVPAYLPPLR